MVAHDVCFCTFSLLYKKWFILVELHTNIISELQKQYTGYIFYISMLDQLIQIWFVNVFCNFLEGKVFHMKENVGLQNC
jgi:hypothetical protein